MGASPSAKTEGSAPTLLWKSVQNSLSAPLKLKGQPHMGNHKGGSRRSRHRRFFSPFSTPICTLFRARELAMGTSDEHRQKVLLVGACDPLPFTHALSRIRTAAGSPVLGPPLLMAGVRCNGMDCFVPSRSSTLRGASNLEIPL